MKRLHPRASAATGDVGGNWWTARDTTIGGGGAREREGRERRRWWVNKERVTLGLEEKSRVNGPPR